MTLLLIIAIIAGLLLSIRLASASIARLGEKKSVGVYRVKYITKTINLALLVFFSIALVSVLGIEYSQVAIFLSSIFAVIGVALFAQWSILSNITASLIIFFGFPYRVGDRIRVMDKDEDISGIIEEIALFHVLIRRGEELITYPNNLILQKGVIKNPKATLSDDPEV
jgi:small-conductance mechanosensitive channel